MTHYMVIDWSKGFGIIVKYKGRYELWSWEVDKVIRKNPIMREAITWVEVL